jgi:hypothetical protein
MERRHRHRHRLQAKITSYYKGYQEATGITLLASAHLSLAAPLPPLHPLFDDASEIPLDNPTLRVLSCICSLKWRLLAIIIDKRSIIRTELYVLRMYQ